jgi:SH3-like domain-containing protein
MKKVVFIIFLLFTVGNRESFAKKKEDSFMSLKFSEVNLRTGPSTDFSLILTYKTVFLPIKVIAEYDNWYKTVDMDGDSGWLRKYLLSSQRTVITKEDTIIYSSPYMEAYPKYKVEKNVILSFVKCNGNRCKVSLKVGRKKYKGWLDKKDIWGI